MISKAETSVSRGFTNRDRAALHHGATGRRFSWLLAIAAGTLMVGTIGRAQVNVTTFQNDIGRTGQNLNETILTPANVNATQFGKLFSHTVDAQIYTQPLYLSGISVNGATHNVVYVATENDSVYAFDADTNGGANASPLWYASMLTSAHGAASGATAVPSNMVSTDIQPLVGITGTPVIDPTSGTLYLVSKTLENNNAVQRLHALDVTSGAEKFGGPVIITASVPGAGTGSSNGTLSFDPLWENQRPGLLLLNGIVWIGFASHGDNGPWHGWVLGYNAATLRQTGAFCTSPNGSGSGIWMSGSGLAADQLDPVNHPYGRMFFPTGNGDVTMSKPYNATMDYGDSELDLDLTNGVPTITDEFTTNQQADLDAEDGDIASGGLMVIPTQTAGSYPHLAVQVGKQGWMYLLNRDNLGGYNSTDQIVQEQQYAVGATGAWSSPAYWNGNVYWWGRGDALKSFALVNGLLSTTPTKSNEVYGYPGATPTISANGNTQGIVWSIDAEGYGTGPAILQAHNATTVSTMLYSSAASGNASRDRAGGAVKFAVPTVANGKVYVDAAGELDFYGLLNSATPAAAPVITPGSESYTGSVSVTITDTTPNAQIFYTTDGSTATTSSTLYTGAITVSSTEIINAVASATGYLVSTQSTATFTNTGQTPVVTFSLPTGTYNAAQTLTLSDSLSGAQIYYTTNGTTPTTSSTLYTGPITIGATETITAIATSTSLGSSTPLAQTYTIVLGATGIQFSQGFASSSGLVVLNGSSQLNDTRLQLTDGLTNEAGSAFYYQPVGVQSFTTDFAFQLSNPLGEGITFVIQNASAGSGALGSNGAGLGYAGVGNSLAIKFDLYSDAGEGPDSTGLYTGGATPTVPSINLSSTGINLHSDDELAVHVTYNGTTLTMTITDMVTAAVWSTNWTINIPTTIGSNTAYVGFTGSTSTQTASQKILTWTYFTTPPAATPTFSPAAGTYSGTQSVTISDSTSGATIYYTTNGTMPTTSSSVYSGPISVSATETLNAIAVAPNYSASSTGTAAYTIQSQVSTPSFSLVAGSYSGTQSVTISDMTSGATIYYTTNGTTPTTSSNVYSGAITVSATETLEAIAVASGLGNSAVATAVYTITAGPAAPVFTPSAGSYSAALTVSISDATAGATIYYQMNNTGSAILYTAPFTMNASGSISAVAYGTNYAKSSTTTATYTITPTTATPVFSLPANTYTSAQTVSITDATAGATIYYTTNGATPTTSSSVYSAPITVATTETLKAIAVAANMANSAVASAAYTINVPGASGLIFSPTSMTFPATNIGTTSAAQVLTVTNSSATAVSVSSYKFSGTNASEFNLSGKTCSTSLAAGASCTLSITFTPSASGTASASLVATDSAQGSPQSVPLSGSVLAAITVSFSPASLTFPATAPGMTSAAQVLTVTNTSSATTMAVSSYKFSGTNASQFNLIGKTCGTSLAAGASCTLTITFTASTSGAATANLVATDNAAGSPQSVPLSGSAMGVPTVSFSPTSLTFPQTKTGSTSAAQVLTVTNTSTTAMAVSTYLFSGTNASEFSLSGKTCSTSLAAGASCTLSIVFKPTVGGSASASLVATDNAAGSPQSVPLSGSALAVPTVSFSPPSISFSTTKSGSTSAPQALTVTNTSTVTMTVSTYLFSGTNASEFSLSGKTCSTSLAAGASCTLSIVFKPTATGTASASLVATDNATGSPQSVPVSGTGN